MHEYDVVVIGSGTAGQTAAYDLHGNGAKTALVEKSESPGGTCALAGCQAKKWFYEVAELMFHSKHLAGKGVVAPPKTSWSDILKEKNKFTYPIPDSTVEGLMSAGIDFFEGNAEFVAPDMLEAGGEKIKAKYFVVATGAVPMKLPVEGAEHIATSSDFLELEELPGKIFFVGGGFISFEFAHFAARLGPENGEIVIGEASDRPLGPFDSEMVDLLVRSSEEEGIRVATDLKIVAVEKKERGFSVATGSGEIYETDLVVHGAGRVADIADLKLEVAGVEFSKRGIDVDEGMRTSNPKIYAIGDCAATTQLARVADYEAHVAADNILADLQGGEKRRIHYGAVPALLFTCPQCGMVGKTEDSLKKEGIEYEKSFAKNIGWPTYRRVGVEHAAYKILVDRKKRILGAHILSDNAAGLIEMFKTAMIRDIAADELHRQSIMTPYPSRESDIVYMLSAFGK